MNEVVLDASAVLTLIFNEKGADQLPVSLLVGALLSTVNLAEVQTKLRQKGYDPAEAWEDASTIIPTIVDFSPSHARIAGDLAIVTRHLGLSLGDRSCLALAIERNAHVYTTDQAWRDLDLGIPIHVIR